MINVKRKGKRTFFCHSMPQRSWKKSRSIIPHPLEIHGKSKLPPPPTIVIPFLNPKPNMGLNAKVWSSKFINSSPQIKTKLPQGRWLSGIALFGISPKKEWLLGFKPHCVHVMKPLL